MNVSHVLTWQWRGRPQELARLATRLLALVVWVECTHEGELVCSSLPQAQATATRGSGPHRTLGPNRRNAVSA
jgi:hypothetical protein